MSATQIGRDDLLAWERERPDDFFTSDPDLNRTLKTRLGERYLEAAPHLASVGRTAAGPLWRLSRETNREENLPRLERFDGLGVRTEEVVFHPSYHEAGRLIWESGVLAGYAQPGRETEQLAMMHLFAQDGEIGHLCPLACTAGLIKLLQNVGSEAQKKKWLPGLLDRDYGQRIHASQFLTEIQGGSDVGTNALVAKKDGAGYTLHGEKWFCSVIDAQLFLMTARPEGAPPGTKGLGLFVVPRRVDGGTNAFHVRRLKWKLGTRAMASAEVDFDGARAEPIGPLDRGFKNVVELVLDTSRVYNAICCAGAMRRAYVEARGFAARRQAFGQPIADYPLIREAISTLRAESMAATASTLRIASMGDRGSDPEARRVAVNVNKYWTSVRNTQMARMAMEIFGGNGAIESFSIIPQLYRDAMVLESWEGTHNTLVQQIARDAARLHLHEPWIAAMEAAVAKTSDQRLAVGLAAASAALRRLADGEGDQRWARRIVDQMATIQALVALHEEHAAHPDPAAEAAIRFLGQRDLKAELSMPPPLEPALFA